MRILVLMTVPLFLVLGAMGAWDEPETPQVVTIEEIYTPDTEDVERLARLINAEAAGEGFLCKVYVANVVVNRMMWYGMTLHEVISKPKQFSAYNNARYNSDFSSEDYEIARDILSGKLQKLPHNVLYFCNPKTATNKKFVEYCKKNLHIQCNNHIFAVKQ